MNKLIQSFTLFVLMGVYSFSYSVDISKAQGVNIHRVGNRMQMYLNCLFKKATPQERKLAAETIKRDATIAVSSGIILMGGGTIAAVYGKEIINKIRNCAKRDTVTSGQEHKDSKQDTIESADQDVDEGTLINSARNSNDLVPATDDILDTLAESDKQEVQEKIAGLTAEKSDTCFTIDGKDILLTKKDNLFIAMITADLSDRTELKLYPYMQQLAQLIAQQNSAEVDVIIDANNSLFKSHFNGKEWSFKDKKLMSQ